MWQETTKNKMSILCGCGNSLIEQVDYILFTRLTVGAQAPPVQDLNLAFSGHTYNVQGIAHYSAWLTSPSKKHCYVKKTWQSRFELDIATSNKLKTEEGQNSQNYMQKTLDWASTYVTH